MIISTMKDVPGHEVQDVQVEVSAVTIRSRHVGSHLGAGLKVTDWAAGRRSAPYGAAVRLCPAPATTTS